MTLFETLKPEFPSDKDDDGKVCKEDVNHYYIIAPNSLDDTARVSVVIEFGSGLKKQFDLQLQLAEVTFLN